MLCVQLISGPGVWIPASIVGHCMSPDMVYDLRMTQKMTQHKQLFAQPW